VSITVNSVNDAPEVAAIQGTDAVDESGTARTYTFSINDVDSTSFSFVAGSPSCGVGGMISGTPNISGNTGTFSCVFQDGPKSHEISATVTDNESVNGTSNTTKKTITVNNALPVVAVSLAGPADCQTTVLLTGQFSDAGGSDGDWAVDINWGDGNHTTYTQLNADASSGIPISRTHTYALPGTYTVTTSVTDKDAGKGTDSDPMTVNQTYTVKFLPPFDGSTPSNLIANTMKAGRTVPVKVTIFDNCRNTYVTGATTSNVTIGVSKSTLPNGTTTDGVETYSDAGNANGNTNLFRWTTDSTGGFWIYNLDSTNAYLNGPMAVGETYRVNVFVGAVKATVNQWALLKPTK